MAKYDEPSLIDGVRSGNERIIKHLMDQGPGAAIIPYILRRGGSVEDARTLQTEAFLILERRIRDGRYEERGKLTAFLISIAARLWLGKNKSNRRCHIAPPDQLEQMAANQPTSLQALIQQEQHAILNSVISRLKPVQRHLIHAHYYDEKRFSEIAEDAADYSYDNIRQIHSRTLQKLRRELQTNL